MDFFAAQELAKKRTRISIALFVLAVLATIIAVYFAFWGILILMAHYGFAFDPASEGVFSLALWSPQRAAWVGGITAIFILISSLMRLSEISSGGIKVVELLGGRFLDPRASDEKEKRLLNVVEEMAIASGYAIPQVAILDNEMGINAFAAAFSPRDAVIVVTKGALESFNREELQGVIGHEFSHLLNGDSKLNLTLHGWVHGLLALSTLGYGILRSFGRSRGSSRRSKGGGGAIILAIILFAVALIIIGSIGHLVGLIIQALISRQREYLADASAIQFTRNPEAFVRALGRIQKTGSLIQAPRAEGFAHCFFNTGVKNYFGSLVATHPPLVKRMAAISPYYEALIEDIPATAPHPVDEIVHPAPAAAATVSLNAMVASAGTLSPEKLDSARALIAEIPPQVSQLLDSDEGAVSVFLAFALSDNSGERTLQLDKIRKEVSPEIAEHLAKAYSQTQLIPSDKRLGVADLSLARARRLGTELRVAIAQTLESLIAADSKLSLWEAFYIEFVRYRLSLPSAHETIPQAKAAETLLSGLLDAQQIPNAPTAFAKLTEGLVLPPLAYRHRTPTAALRAAIPSLKGFSYIQRRELLIAAGRAVKIDGALSASEAEIIRTFASLIEIPVPTRI